MSVICHEGIPLADWTPERIVARYYPDLPRLVKGVARLRRVARHYHDRDDALGWAAFGLFRGASRYDHSRGTSPLTCVVWYARRYLQLGISRHCIDLAGRQWVRSKYRRPLILPASCFAQKWRRDNTDDDDRDWCVLARAVARPDDTVERRDDARHAKQQLGEFLKYAFPSEKEALRLVYLCGYTLTEAGKRLGVSTQRVHQWVNTGLLRCRFKDRSVQAAVLAREESGYLVDPRAIVNTGDTSTMPAPKTTAKARRNSFNGTEGKCRACLRRRYCIDGLCKQCREGAPKCLKCLQRPTWTNQQICGGCLAAA